MFLRYFLTFKSRKFSHTKKKWQKEFYSVFFLALFPAAGGSVTSGPDAVMLKILPRLPYEAFRDSSEPGRICFWPRKWFASGKFNSNLLRTDFKISATFGVGNFWLHNVRKCLLNDLFWLLIVEISTFSLADFFSHPENLSYFFVET